MGAVAFAGTVTRAAAVLLPAAAGKLGCNVFSRASYLSARPALSGDPGRAFSTATIAPASLDCGNGATEVVARLPPSCPRHDTPTSERKTTIGPSRRPR